MFPPIPLSLIEEPLQKPLNLENLVNYITDDSIKEEFKKAREAIKVLEKSIEEYFTRGYIGFKFKGRQIGGLSPHRTPFDLWAHVIGTSIS